MLLCLTFVFLWSIKLVYAVTEGTKPPHIVIILADDMGWNDVGFHGSGQIPTPNMDALAYSGVQLHSHYSPPLCTPARAALLTGKYPIHTGTQHLVILEPEPRGLPLSETLLPELLKQRGYSTHIVGKWHLGSFRTEYTPTKRGFDSHYGYWNGFQDYYEHTVEATFNSSMYGIDMRRNLTLSTADRGQYATHLYSNEASSIIREHPDDKPLFLYLAHLAPHTGTRRRPLQPPPKPHPATLEIKDSHRRDYAAMVSELDKGVGEVIKALHEKNYLNNTVLLLLSDHGAPTVAAAHMNYGSNYPLRGVKDTPWEGGTRTLGVFWTPKIKASRLHNHILHMTDWLPTLYHAAGGDPKSLPNIDGVDAWDSLLLNRISRQELLINIDNPEDSSQPFYFAMRRGRWKFVWVQSKKRGADWLGDSGRDVPYNWTEVGKSDVAMILKVNLTRAHELRADATVRCPAPPKDISDCVDHPCLFDIESDPCETLDLFSLKKELSNSLGKRIKEWIAGSVKAGNLKSDPRADPALHGGAWVPWKDDEPHVIFDHSEHWEYVGAAGSIVAIFMIVCGSWSFARHKGCDLCGCHRKDTTTKVRMRGPVVAKQVKLFEEREKLSRAPSPTINSSIGSI